MLARDGGCRKHESSEGESSAARGNHLDRVGWLGSRHTSSPSRDSATPRQLECERENEGSDKPESDLIWSRIIGNTQIHPSDDTSTAETLTVGSKGIRELPSLRLHIPNMEAVGATTLAS